MEDDQGENKADIELGDGNLDDSVVAEEGAKETIQKLRATLKACETEKQEYLTGWQRARADLINARRRDEAAQKEFLTFANKELVEKLLPVLESFDLAMGNIEAWEKVDKNWRTGVESIYAQLKRTLAEHGLEEINPEGKPFTHERDEATAYESVTDETQHHLIVRVVQKGYALHGKLLRAPKVVVGEYKDGGDTA